MLKIRFMTFVGSGPRLVMMFFTCQSTLPTIVRDWQVRDILPSFQLVCLWRLLERQVANQQSSPSLIVVTSRELTTT